MKTSTQLPPGTQPRPEEVEQKIRSALAELPDTYRPRTRHVNGRELPTDAHTHPLAPAGSQPNYANRLLLSASPYLRQHAHNPVDWRPWGQEALREAVNLHRPVFLSIGYATCHWCHVMEHESFENLQIATLMNTLYVPIKVDREERPDVDATYMTAVQAMTGQGGWPMSVWLWPVERADGTVEGLPFFAGTYFPPFDGQRGMRRGFHGILQQLADVCVADAERVLLSGREIAGVIARQLGRAESGNQLPNQQLVDRAIAEVAQTYDAEHGGRSWAPKFPSSMPIRLLLRHFHRTGETLSRDMALQTLKKMAMGGIRDHVGGGWHRYSTDAKWFAPHFEKMLYDQGLIGLALCDAIQVAPEPLLIDALEETLEGMVRELRSDDGAFCAATDADSEGAEGLFFLWRIEELQKILGDEDALWLAELMGCTQAGTFEHSNILNLQRIPDENEWPRLKKLRAKLRAERLKREPPLRDDKIVTAWNGLAISAFARGANVLRQPQWSEIAVETLNWLLTHMVRAGRLLRSRLGQEATIPAFLDDHAALVQALLDVHEMTQDLHWLQKAIHWQTEQDRLFLAAEGGYLSTAVDAETVLVRARPDHDGAEPSGNSLSAMNLVRLAALTGNPQWEQRLVQHLQAFEPTLQTRPGAMTEFLLAVEAYDKTQTAVLVGQNPSEWQGFLLETLRAWHPHVLPLAVTERELPEWIEIAPLLEGKIAQNGQTTAYVCREGNCELPTTDVAVFSQLLR